MALISISADSCLNVCGEPTFSPDVDAGMFVWKDCGSTGNWRFRATAGGATVYQGSILSDVQIAGVGPFSFEGIDRVELINDSTGLDFLMKIARSGLDGIGIEFPVDASSACLDIDFPSGVAPQIVVGQNNAALSLPFDLITLDSC